MNNQCKRAAAVDENRVLTGVVIIFDVRQLDVMGDVDKVLLVGCSASILLAGHSRDIGIR